MKTRTITILLLSVTFLVMGRLLWGEFLVLDDNFTVLGNPLFNPPTWQTIQFYWTNPQYGLYYPMTNTLWAAIAALTQHRDAAGALYELDPLYFHLANLLLHAGSVLIVFRILLRLVQNDHAAMLGALLFAIHPLQVESVAWISGMKDLLAGFFALLALWQYLRFAQLPDDSPRGSATRATHFLLGIVLLQLGMLSKASVMTLPLLAGAIDWRVIRRPLPRVILSAGIWQAACVPLMVVARLAQPGADIPPVPLHLRPLVVMDSLAFYLWKLVYPVKLGIDYGRTAQFVIDAGLIRWTWIVPALLAGIVLLFRSRTLGAAGMIFALAPLPTLGLVPLLFAEHSTVADHYLYLAMLGPALAVAWAMRQAGSRAIRTMISLALVALGIISIRQTRFWRDDVALFSQALRVNPDSSMSATNLGSAWQRLGEHQKAIESFSRAVEREPDAVPAVLGKGLSLIFLGRIDEGLEEAQRAMDILVAQPPDKRGDLSKPLLAIGHALLSQGRREEALGYYRLAIQAIPDRGAQRQAMEMLDKLQQEPTGASTAPR